MLTDSNNVTTKIVEQLEKDGWSLYSSTIDSGGYNKDSCFGILLSYKGKNKFTTKYHKGYGHRKWLHRNKTFGYAGYWYCYIKNNQVVSNIPYNLKDPSKCPDNYRRDNQQRIWDDFAKLTEPISPTLDEVIFSLYTDATCASNCPTFEEFCSDFEYSTDSISATKIYEKCRDAYFFFIKCGISFEYLDELFREY